MTDVPARVLRIIAEHYAIHEKLPTVDQIRAGTAPGKVNLGIKTGCLKKSKIEDYLQLLKDTGKITAPGKYTERPHLTAKGFPWIEKLIRDYCPEPEPVEALVD